MTPEYLFSQGLAVAIIGGLAWFGWRELWPWLRDRDKAQRDHNREMEAQRETSEQLEHERRHELEQRRIEIDGLMAGALTTLAEAIRGCPLRSDEPAHG